MNRVFLFIAFIANMVCTGQGASPKKGFIKAGEYNVYYEREGKGDAVLLVHAGLQNHTMWKKQVAALSKKYFVITIDLPYHGNTTGHDTALLAKDVIRIVLDSLDVNKVTIAGLSMGSAVAMDFVVGYPERVNKAIFVSAGINGYENKYAIDSITLSWYPRFVALLNAKDTVKAAKEFAKTWAEGIDAKDYNFKKPVSQYVYTTTLQTLKQHQLISWPHLENHPPAMESIANIQVPVLIVHGDKDLPFINTASRYLEKTIPHSKRVLMKGVAHMLNMEKPEEFTKIVMEFMRK